MVYGLESHMALDFFRFRPSYQFESRSRVSMIAVDAVEVDGVEFSLASLECY